MTEEIFAYDGYLTEFEAVVTATDGDWVSLDSTAFYPGGGGQACDTGALGGKKVERVERRKNEIWHLCPGHDLRVGDRMWCSVDWERRYELMKGHTAEHMLFGALSRMVPEMGIVKIDIDLADKYVVVDRDVEWGTLAAAVSSVNAAIAENLPVTKSVMNRDDPELNGVRAKLERIEGKEISVVEIGDFDIAACGGTHVMETGEIGYVIADRKVSAGKDGYAIHFKVDEAAKKAASGLAYRCLEVSDALSSKPSDVVRAAANILAELEDARALIKKSGKALLADAERCDISGVAVICGAFPASADVLAETAEKWRDEGCVAVLATDSSPSSVILASGDGRIDCRKILSDALAAAGGRGGGKKDMARGGLPHGKDPREFLDAVLGAVRDVLGK